MRSLTIALLALLGAPPAAAQVLVRVGDPHRATYSELHEALKAGTPAADSVRQILGQSRAAPLWLRIRAALTGAAPWSDAHLALTRLAQLRDRAYADSAARLARRIEAGEVRGPAAQDPGDLLPPLHAVALERSRAVRGDAAVLRDILRRVPAHAYDVGDAWVLGRIPGAADSVSARFLAAAPADTDLRVRYLTLLTFSADSAAIPLLARVYAAPDSFGIPPRLGARASDALLWIGTRSSLQALLDARGVARARKVYDSPELRHADLDFLANDSSAVISRTGGWLTDWVAQLR